MEELSRHWRPVLMAYFLRRVRNHSEAEDLTQELLVRLIARDGGRETAGSEGYVFQTAANLLKDRARRQRVRTSFAESASRLDGADLDLRDPFRVVAGRAAVSAMARAIQQMPDRTRDIFILYRMENISQDVIAETLGISVSAVKKQVARATALLMVVMREEL